MPERDDEYGGLLMQQPMFPLPVETCHDLNKLSAIADSQTLRPGADPHSRPTGETISITVYGEPAGQGQITFLGVGRGAKHTNEKKLKPWRHAIVDAALAATGHHLFSEYHPGTCAICGVPKKRHALLVGVPVHVEVTITVEKPKSAPKRRRTWPITRHSTDIDHHARAVLDSLSAAGVFADDSQVVKLTISKGYPLEDIDTLEQPGATIHLWPIGGNQ